MTPAGACLVIGPCMRRMPGGVCRAGRNGVSLQPAVQAVKTGITHSGKRKQHVCGQGLGGLNHPQELRLDEMGTARDDHLSGGSQENTLSDSASPESTHEDAPDSEVDSGNTRDSDALPGCKRQCPGVQATGC